MAIRHHFPKAAIDAVDIDAEALDLAQCFFEAQEDAHLMLHNEDGVKFLTKHGVTSQVAPHSLGFRIGYTHSGV